MTPRRWLLLLPAVPVALVVAVELGGDWALGVRLVRPAPTPDPPLPTVDAAPDPAAAAVGVFLQSFAAAARDQPHVAASLLDAERFFAALTRSDTYRTAGAEADPLTGPVRARQALSEAVRAGGPGFAPESVEVRQVLPGVGANEFVAAARHRTAGRTTTHRWWLVRSERGWKVFDLEDTRTGLRLSRQAAAQFSRGVSPEVRAGLAALGPAGAKLAAGDADGAAQALAPARAVPLPADGFAVRCLIEGGIAAMKGRAAEARDWADQAHAANPGMPAVQYLRASAAAAVGDWAAVEAPARVYLDAVGPDAPTARLLGTALRERGRPADAAAVFELGLRDDPGRADLRAARDHARGLATGKK